MPRARRLVVSCAVAKANEVLLPTRDDIHRGRAARALRPSARGSRAQQRNLFSLSVKEAAEGLRLMRRLLRYCAQAAKAEKNEAALVRLVVLVPLVARKVGGRAAAAAAATATVVVAVAASGGTRVGICTRCP